MSDQKKIKQKDIKCNQHAYTPVFFDDKEASADSLYIFVVNDGKFVLVSDRGQINIKPGLGVEGKIKITQLPSTEPVKQEPADAKP
jgi:6-phosphogluconolactonase (cycloisomerase 2 family)